MFETERCARPGCGHHVLGHDPIWRPPLDGYLRGACLGQPRGYVTVDGEVRMVAEIVCECPEFVEAASVTAGREGQQ